MDSWESPEEEHDRDGHHEQDDLPFQIALEQLELLSEAVHSHLNLAHRLIDLLTTQEIADESGESRRTVHRRLKELAETGAVGPKDRR